jgi:hypothetical protein
MWSKIRYWLVLCCCGVIWLGGCTSAWQPGGPAGFAMQPGRYLQKFYRSPDFEPATAVYQAEPFPVERVSGLSQDQASTLFNDEVLKAMAANGLKVNQEKPQEGQGKATCVLSGNVDRFMVASPTWRFLSGRGQADLRVVGEIRRGQEVVFVFQDEVAINPPVNPRHRATLEPDLIGRLAVRRFAANLVNELLLPAGKEPGETRPAAAPPPD